MACTKLSGRRMKEPSDKLDIGNSPKQRRYGLSKSRISAFEQCPKRLWLSVHRANEAKFDEGSELRFAVGNEVGDIACSLHPDGIMVEAEPDLAAALAKTEALLSSDRTGPIFEATFQHEGLLVRVDILEQDSDGSWRIAEVKSSTKAKNYHHGDLATQVWVLEQAGLKVAKAAIRHLNNQFELSHVGEWDGLFSDTELLQDITPIIEERAEIVSRARSTLYGDEPDIPIGPHCSSPFQCEFSAYCSASIDAGPDWPVTVLPSGAGKRWLQNGVADLFDIDVGELKSDIHKRVYQATVTDQPYHDVEGARSAMSQWKFPRSWLDFETIAFAVPRWIGTRPYQQIPFQFSVHIEQPDGSIEHQEFLDLSGEDPRRACATALLELLPSTGAIIAYNANFEKGCIKTLAKACTDLAPELEQLYSRVVDLLPVTKAAWYHRDQRGSWSIKAVLPTISNGSAYTDLAVQSGVEAQRAFLEAIDPETSPERKHKIDADLRAYCQKDTRAMVDLAKHLVGSDH